MATIMTITSIEAQFLHRGDWLWSLAATINRDNSAELVLSMRCCSPIYRHVPDFNLQAVVDIVGDADIYDIMAVLKIDTDDVFDELSRQLFA